MDEIDTNKMMLLRWYWEGELIKKYGKDFYFMIAKKLKDEVGRKLSGISQVKISTRIMNLYSPNQKIYKY